MICRIVVPVHGWETTQLGQLLLRSARAELTSLGTTEIAGVTLSRLGLR